MWYVFTCKNRDFTLPPRLRKIISIWSKFPEVLKISESGYISFNQFSLKWRQGKIGVENMYHYTYASSILHNHSLLIHVLHISFSTSPPHPSNLSHPVITNEYMPQHPLGLLISLPHPRFAPNATSHPSRPPTHLSPPYTCPSHTHTPQHSFQTLRTLLSHLLDDYIRDPVCG